jgi:hypothetical protein
MKIEIKQLEGRDHWVVPVVMITTGAWAGSQGLVYYPTNELRTSVPYWDGKPVVVYHPDFYGNTYAGNPEVFNRQKIGSIFNTSFDGTRLKANAWIDIARVATVDPRIAVAIRKKQMVEVSTGLCTDFEKVKGVSNGRAYEVVARNLKPDHLAILPDRKGACSIADGAGLIRNLSNQIEHSLASSF